MQTSLPVMRDPRGNLTFIQQGDQISFTPRRVSWMHDIRTRGSVIHDQLDAETMIVALSGSFDVQYDALGGRTVPRTLIDPSVALTVPPGTPVYLDNISHNAVALFISGGRSGQAPRVATPVPADSHATTRLDDAHVITLGEFVERHGLWRVTTLCDTPIAPLRLFYLYDVPAGSTRGGHSHYRAHEVITAVAGSFDVTLTDGHDTRTFRLSDPRRGLYIPCGLWRTIDGFSAGSVCLVLTTELYSEADYVRDYETFKILTANKLPR